MSDIKKALLNTILGLVNLVVVTLFWRQSLLLVVLLLVLSVLMLAIRTDKRSLVVYAVGFLFGPLAESVAISQGAWTYPGYTIPGLGIPLWLPFLWANASLFIVNTEKLSHILFKDKL